MNQQQTNTITKIKTPNKEHTTKYDLIGYYTEDQKKKLVKALSR
jgi:hypothetical protein